MLQNSAGHDFTHLNKFYWKFLVVKQNNTPMTTKYGFCKFCNKEKTKTQTDAEKSTQRFCRAGIFLHFGLYLGFVVLVNHL